MWDEGKLLKAARRAALSMTSPKGRHQKRITGSLPLNFLLTCSRKNISGCVLSHFNRNKTLRKPIYATICQTWSFGAAINGCIESHIAINERAVWALSTAQCWSILTTFVTLQKRAQSPLMFDHISVDSTETEDRSTLLLSRMLLDVLLRSESAI